MKDMQFNYGIILVIMDLKHEEESFWRWRDNLFEHMILWKKPAFHKKVGQGQFSKRLLKIFNMIHDQTWTTYIISCKVFWKKGQFRRIPRWKDRERTQGIANLMGKCIIIQKSCLQASCLRFSILFVFLYSFCGDRSRLTWNRLSFPFSLSHSLPLAKNQSLHNKDLSVLCHAVVPCA